MNVKFGLIVLVIIFNIGPAFAYDLSSLPAGHWLEIEGSNLAEVLPVPLPPGYTGPSSIMSAWSGGAFDSKRDRLLVWGGGHANYAGNEVYAFDLSTFSWSRISDPTPNDLIPLGRFSYETYLDGNPAARETYDSLEYLPEPFDGLWNQGGSRWKTGSSGTPTTWLFNLNTGAWEQKADKSYSRGGYPATAYDPFTGHIFHRDRYYIMEYAPEADSWSFVHKDSAGSWHDDETAVIDPIRGKMYFVGGSNFRVLDLEDYTFYDKYLPLLGDSEIVHALAPGLAYSPVDDTIVAWGGDADYGLDPAAVYTLDLDTLVWTKHMPAPSNTVAPTNAAKWGTFGRFRYVPSKNVFVLVNSIHENVYVYRFSGGFSPDNTPPSVPQDLNGIGEEGVATLTWDSSVDLESGVRIYNVFRDNVLIGETVHPFYKDEGLPSGSYEYEVLAVNNASLESGRSAPFSVEVCEIMENIIQMLRDWKNENILYMDVEDRLMQWKSCGQ